MRRLYGIGVTCVTCVTYLRAVRVVVVARKGEKRISYLLRRARYRIYLGRIMGSRQPPAKPPQPVKPSSALSAPVPAVPPANGDRPTIPQCNDSQPNATVLEVPTAEPIRATAIRYLLEGGRLSAVAATVGVDRTTLWRWSRTPEWQAAITRERELLHTAVRAQLRALALESVYIVDAALRSEDKALALRAALAVLKGTGALPGHAERS